jgi:hypothetical protein
MTGLPSEKAEIEGELQFCGLSRNGSTDGNINDINFGHVEKAADPRIGQVALKLNF